MSRRWLRGIFLRNRLDREVEVELEDHLSRRVEDLVRAGEHPATARAMAERELGNLTTLKEDVRDAWIVRWLDDSVQDVKLGVRGLVRNPHHTVSVVLTLALGIGANTAIFSVLNGWLFRPLPVPEADRITVLASVEPGRRDALVSFSNFADLRAQAPATFSGIFAYAFRIAGLRADAETRQFVMAAVSANYFSSLGVGAEHGRVFVPGEGETPGQEVLAILGHAYWKKAFNGDPAVIGKPVAINGVPATIVGIAAETFQGTVFAFPFDGYVTINALAQQPQSPFWSRRENRTLSLLGRMKPDVDLRQAQTSINLVVNRLASQYPDTNRGIAIQVIPEAYARPVPLVAGFVPAIATLFLALPVLLLLMACLNVSGIILTGAEARSREMAVRASLGGGRGRLIRQLLTETMLKAILGSVAGVSLGILALRSTGTYLDRLFTSTSNYSLSMDTGFDWRVFAYTLLIVLAAGFVAGLWPAVRASRAEVNSLLHTGGRLATPGRSWINNALIVGQIAGSLILLIVSALFVRSLGASGRADLGFDPHNVLAVFVDPAQLGYDERRTNDLYRQIQERLRALPSVEAVSLSAGVPLTFLGGAAPVYVEGRDRTPAGMGAPPVSFNAIDQDYLPALRTPVFSGRNFSNADSESSPLVAIVNQTMQRTLWPGVSAVGKRFSTLGAAGPFLEVIGVAKDGQYRVFSPEPQPFFYVPASQKYGSARTIVIRSTVPPASLMPAVRAAIAQTAPDLLINNMLAMDDVLQGLAGLFLLRAAALLSGFLGLIGLGLAIVGTYGVVSFGVSRRTREFGIRMALGARPAALLRLVMGHGLRLVLTGLAVGLTGAMIVKGPIAAKLLPGPSRPDPLLYASVCLILAGAGLLACYLPARAAARANPADTLRAD